ncbi:MAG: hypothetical protein O9340_14800 [Cyclobacteriaceae bacterium]|jgi:hypothetical protein|nr:hypothetical protein [Cyclobacteriaceae bacterium]
MIKKILSVFITSIILLLFSCENDSALSEDQKNFFVRYIGDNGNQEAVDIELLNDGSFIILFNTDSDGTNKDFGLANVSQTGDLIWLRTYGDPSLQEVAKDLSIVPEFQNGFAFIIGYSILQVNNGDMGVLVTAADGTQLKNVKDAFVNANDDLKSVTYNINDGGVVVTGETLVGSNKQSVIVRLKPLTNADFGFYAANESWGRIDFGGGEDEEMVTLFVNDLSTGLDPYHWFMSTNEIGVGATDFNFYAAALDASGIVSKGTRLPDDVNDDNDDFLNFVLQEGSNADGIFYSMIGTRQVGQNLSVQALKIFMPKIGGEAALNIIGNFSFNGNYRGIGISKIPGGYWFLLKKEIVVNDEVVTNLSLQRVNDVFTPQGTVVDFPSELSVEPAKIKIGENQKIFVLSTATIGNQRKVQLIKLNRSGQFSN